MTVRGAAVALLISAAAFAAGAWLAPEIGLAPASLVALIAASIGAVAAERVSSYRARRTARDIDEIVAGTRGTVAVPAKGGWSELARAVNRLAIAHRRRGERLERERPWRRELVDSLVQASLLFSSDSRLLAANQAARELLGIPEEAAGLTVVQAVGSAPLAEAVREVRTGTRPLTIDVEHGAHHLRANVTQVGDETLLIITDRTRELRVEEVRRNFVVNASHELKTPVTSIQTLAEALEVTASSAPERVGPLVKQLGEEAERLARLVKDLLDLRRLEERGPLERAPVDLAELTRRIVAEQHGRSEEAEVEVEVEAPDHAIVAGVPGDLEVIVKNLVANAVQYNRPGGRVVVRIQREDGRQVVQVVDTGIGIPQQDLGRIFERFYRVDTVRSRATGGTGLGLSIVRHAVERHGGTVRVDSLLGEGTTFTVDLPIGAAD